MLGGAQDRIKAPNYVENYGSPEVEVIYCLLRPSIPSSPFPPKLRKAKKKSSKAKGEDSPAPKEVKAMARVKAI